MRFRLKAERSEPVRSVQLITSYGQTRRNAVPFVSAGPIASAAISAHYLGVKAGLPGCFSPMRLARPIVKVEIGRVQRLTMYPAMVSSVFRCLGYGEKSPEGVAADCIEVA